MKPIYLVLMITLMTQNSCESTGSSNSSANETEMSDSLKRDTVITSREGRELDLHTDTKADSADIQDTSSVKQKTSEQKAPPAPKKNVEQNNNSINIGDAMDTDTIKSVRDRPDYIGTPCEYVDGECIRHDHKK